MIKVLLCGSTGAMGKRIIEAVDKHPDFIIHCGIAQQDDSEHPFPVMTNLEALDNPLINEVDIIIDYSNATITDTLINFALAHQLPIVLCTTGLSKETESKIIEASQTIPIFKSGNMSLGINLMSRLLKQAAEFLGDFSDIDIIEKHHNRKLDAPSGTALMLAHATNAGLEVDRSIVLGREKEGAKDQSVINIHSVRGGNIVGEHEVIFSFDDERLTLSHGAYSRNVFATGTLNAAKYLVRKTAGLYDMSQMLDEVIGTNDMPKIDG